MFVENWRCDQYRWVNEGVHLLPRKSPELRKHYFLIDGPDGASTRFRKCAYQLISNQNVTLIHYMGDEKAAVDFSHRGAKSSDRCFIRTLPSYIHSCKELVKSSNASLVYKKEVATPKCDPGYFPVCTPRNVKQLRNLHFKNLQETRISRDALYNLHRIAYDAAGFVWHITTFPDLVWGLKILFRSWTMFFH